MMTKRPQERVPRAWHPVAWSAYPVIWLYVENADEAWSWEIAAPLLISFVLAALLWWVLRRDFPSTTRRAVVLSAMMVVLLGYGHIEASFRNILLRTRWGRMADDLTLPLSVALLSGLYLLARTMRGRDEIVGITRFLNVAAAASLVLIGATMIPARLVAHDSAAKVSHETSRLTGEGGPDIFLFMLDAYAGADVLESHYGIDNAPFLDALEERGFFVARHAHGNYQWTSLAMASLLNMRYILEPEEGPRRLPIAWNRTEYAVRPQYLDSIVVHELRRRGYEFIAFETPQSGLQLYTADRFLVSGRGLSEFQRAALDATLPMMLMAAADIPINRLLNDAHRRRRIQFIFDSVKTFSGADRPAFVLAHVMAPHPPFVFHRDGSPNRAARETTDAEYVAGYSEQLLYINACILDAIDDLQSRLPNAVIVVQSDHGARSPALRSDHLDSYAREFLSSLNAVYVPGGVQYDRLSPGFSQVNTFRYLFGAVFDDQRTLLPDISYLEVDAKARLFVPVEWRGFEPIFVDTESTPRRAGQPE